MTTTTNTAAATAAPAMTDAELDAILAWARKPTQRKLIGRGYLAITWFSSCVVVNGKKCTTLADAKSAVTVRIDSRGRASRKAVSK